MIRLIKKKAKSIVCSVLAAVTLFTMNPAVFATETVLQTAQRQPAVRQTTR